VHFLCCVWNVTLISPHSLLQKAFIGSLRILSSKEDVRGCRSLLRWYVCLRSLLHFLRLTPYLLLSATVIHDQRSRETVVVRLLDEVLIKSTLTLCILE
jgi:hypothetical protein